jgi:hypothetical protein
VCLVGYYKETRHLFNPFHSSHETRPAFCTLKGSFKEFWTANSQEFQLLPAMQCVNMKSEECNVLLCSTAGHDAVNIGAHQRDKVSAKITASIVREVLQISGCLYVQVNQSLIM